MKWFTLPLNCKIQPIVFPALYLCHGLQRHKPSYCFGRRTKAHFKTASHVVVSKARFAVYRSLPWNVLLKRLFCLSFAGESDNKATLLFGMRLGKHFLPWTSKKRLPSAVRVINIFTADFNCLRYFLFMCLLCQKAAQDVIGCYFMKTQQSADILLEKAFEFRGYVDNFRLQATIEGQKQESLHTITQQKNRQALCLSDRKIKRRQCTLLSAVSLRPAFASQRHRQEPTKFAGFTLEKSNTKKKTRYFSRPPQFKGRSAKNTTLLETFATFTICDRKQKQRS